MLLVFGVCVGCVLRFGFLYFFFFCMIIVDYSFFSIFCFFFLVFAESFGECLGVYNIDVCGVNGLWFFVLFGFICL